MMHSKKNAKQKQSKSAALGFEEKLLTISDELLGHKDMGKYSALCLAYIPVGHLKGKRLH